MKRTTVLLVTLWSIAGANALDPYLSTAAVGIWGRVAWLVASASIATTAWFFCNRADKREAQLRDCHVGCAVAKSRAPERERVMGETMSDRDECQCGLDWGAHSDRDRMHCAERFGFDWRAMAAPTASHTIAALEAENTRLREAVESLEAGLRPFARIVEGVPESIPDATGVGASYEIKLGDCRIARALLAANAGSRERKAGTE